MTERRMITKFNSVHGRTIHTEVASYNYTELILLSIFSYNIYVLP